MRQKFVSFFVLFLQPFFAQTLVTHNYGGSGSDAANAIATDPAGNIYIAGTTTSFDLPLLNPSQPLNPGTQLLYSTNAGFTWRPLANLPDAFSSGLISQTIPIAVDPTNPQIFYVGSNGVIFKTTDGGQHFSSSRILPAGYTDITILIDRFNPSTLYAEVPVPGGIFKSTDAGATWSGAVLGLPSAYPGPMAIDPFHPQTLWLAIGGTEYYTTDGANIWSQAPLPAFTNGGVSQFVFDHGKPDTLYAFGQPNNGPLFFIKSADGGKSWASLPAAFQQPTLLAADPVHAGWLYLLSTANLFYRTTDGGLTWQSFPFPTKYVTAMAVDPGNTNIILAGSYRSKNGGETWSPAMPSRDIQMTFAPSGKDLVYASGPLTSDAFIAKFKPDGKTLEFATYYGGMGNETASGIQLDASGNIWIAGTTTSFDLPGAQNGSTRQLSGAQNAFVAKFSPQGELLTSTYLGGNDTETVASLKLDSQGDPWIFGRSTSSNFPPGITPTVGESNVFLAKIDSSGSHLLYAKPVEGFSQAGGMTIDASDNIILTGVASNTTGQYSPQAIVVKLSPQGDTIFKKILAGTTAVGATGPDSIGNELESIGVAVAADSSGIYVTGNSAAADFPTTPGAYQTALKGTACPYPTSAYDTGLIGTIYSYSVDDVFVTKLSLDGKSILYSTLLGGSCYDRPTDIAVTPSGAVFVTGETDSIDFPQVHAQQGAPGVQIYKSFVSMLSNDGSSLLYSSYLEVGSSPKLALNSGGTVDIAGDIGYGAQTITYSGFPNGPLVPQTKAALALLNVSAAPEALNLTNALNAFSLLPGPVAAGEIIELTVPDFKPAQSINLGIADSQPLPTSLGNTQVLFDGKAVPLIAISAGKIECIAPQDFGSNATTSVQVNWNGKLSNVLQEDIAPTALGLLSANGTGTGAANARNQDGTLNSPSNPAKAGSKVTVFFTGAGNPPATVSPLIGGAVSEAPLHGFVPGIYSVTFEIPTNAVGSSPLGVTLYAPGGTILVAGSASQALMVYVK